MMNRDEEQELQNAQLKNLGLRRFGGRQLSFLLSVGNASWHVIGQSWVWGSLSLTLQIMESLEKRGIVEIERHGEVPYKFRRGPRWLRHATALRLKVPYRHECIGDDSDAEMVEHARGWLDELAAAGEGERVEILLVKYPELKGTL